jgi:hypothetical protein
VGSFEQQATCQHFLDQVEPAIRYCTYQISRRGGTAPDPAELLAAAGAGGGTGPGAGVLLGWGVCGGWGGRGVCL